MAFKNLTKYFFGATLIFENVIALNPNSRHLVPKNIQKIQMNTLRGIKSFSIPKSLNKKSFTIFRLQLFSMKNLNFLI